ncbi:hypothetical protein HK405_001441, partial [Cladochytrium tenue]
EPASPNSPLDASLDVPIPDLFVFPAQSNFNGRRHPLDWIGRFQRLPRRRGRRWVVLVDAAAHGPIDLAANPADLLLVSFYKLFGYPTGLAALVVSRSAADALLLAPRRAALRALPPRVRRRLNAASVPMTGDSLDLELAHLFQPRGVAPAAIRAALAGFDWLDSLGGWSAVKAASCALADSARAAMRGLAHPTSGSPLCRLLLDETPTPNRDAKAPFAPAQYGPVVAFLVLDAAGAAVPASEVVQLAALHGFTLRSGCFCNPGACATLLDASAPTASSQSLPPTVHGRRRRACGEDRDALGRPAAALRISFGPGNSTRDVDRWLGFLRFAFLARASPDPQPRHTPALTMPAVVSAPSRTSVVGMLRAVRLFPIKSCGALD